LHTLKQLHPRYLEIENVEEDGLFSFGIDIGTGNRPQDADSRTNWGASILLPNNVAVEALDGTREIVDHCSSIIFSKWGYQDDECIYGDANYPPQFIAHRTSPGQWEVASNITTDNLRQLNESDIDAFITGLARS
jgi:hypothetical protein